MDQFGLKNAILEYVSQVIEVSFWNRQLYIITEKGVWTIYSCVGNAN